MMGGEKMPSRPDHGLSKEAGHGIQPLSGFPSQDQMQFLAHVSLLGFPLGRGAPGQDVQ
jgi:hypothetical protein